LRKQRQIWRKQKKLKASFDYLTALSNRLTALYAKEARLETSTSGSLGTETAAAIMNELQNIRNDIGPMKQAMKSLLDLTLDPWENIHSELTETVKYVSNDHLDNVSTYYSTPKRHYCMVLGRVTHCDVICAHIWPRWTYGKGLDTVGLTRENVNNPRNFLRLHRSIEKAFDRKRLSLVCDDSEGDEIQLTVIILDPSLFSERFEVNNTTMSFADLHNRPFAHKFTPSQKPYLRLISLHAVKSIEKGQLSNWIPAGDFPGHRDRALRLARQSLDSVQLDALF
jgi:hypothetical protein